DLWPSVAVGLQDFLGTGIYSGEYVAATKGFFDGTLKVTGGVGWGRFAGLNDVPNPFAEVFESFEDRGEFDGSGGEVSFGRFFQGEDMGFFAGVEWQTPVEGLRIKAEYSGDDYDEEAPFAGFEPSVPLSAGVEYRILDGIEIGAYYAYGTDFGVRLTVSGNPMAPLSPSDGEPAPLPVNPRPLPVDLERLAGLGTVAGEIIAGAPSVSYHQAGIRSVSIDERVMGVRWAQAETAPSADHVCPSDSAAAIDAEYGVIDVVTFVHADTTVLCTVALREAGARAIELTQRERYRHPTDWFADDAVRNAAVDAVVRELEPDRLGLLGIDLQPTETTIYVENGKFRSMPRAIGRTARAMARNLPPSVETFAIVPVEGSLPVVKVILNRSDIEDFIEKPDAALAMWRAAEITDAEPPNWFATDRTLQQFPRFSWGISPLVPVNLFDPDQPLQADLSLAGDVKVEVLPGLSFAAAAQGRLVGQLDGLEAESTSELPAVRSDIAEYLDEGDPAITRLTADYVTKLDNALYARFSAGMLERMFGGFSTELLWKPAAQSWGVGGEINFVRQRDFSGFFGFQNFNQVTGHVSVYWDTGFYGITAQVDGGRYLAGDYGGTLTLSRRFANGWELGAFATFTDVPFDEFGEGSFDRGIILTIPFNWVLPYESRSELRTVLRPLTVDGGQRLVIANRLYPLVQDADRGGLGTQFGSFWQ
ncbi:MAG: YjbH domain-containing protein, partial [Pseudomonadota bacterium]